MKKESKIIISLIVVILMMGAYIFYIHLLDSENADNGNLPTNESAMITISLEKSDFTLGETINVTLTLQNIGSENIRFEPFILGGNTYFNITNSSGQRIGEVWIDNYIVDKRILEPGESHSQKIAFQELYPLHQPDDYIINARVYFEGYEFCSANEIPFTIIE